jgi:type VI secretion system secreted protein Hcp
MAQTNIYLKLDGCNGESLDSEHRDWIEVESFSWGVDNPSSFAIAQGGQATQAHIAQFNIQKRADKGSINLFKCCLTGKHLPSGILECLKLDGDKRIVYLRIQLTDIMVSNFQWSGTGGEHLMHEQVSLVFAQFKETYTLQQNVGSSAGAIEFGYNIQTARQS